MLIFFGNEVTSCCAHDAHIFSYAGSYAESTREISLAQSFPRKLKGPPNDPPLFSCFLPSSLSVSSLSTFSPFSLSFSSHSELGSAVQILGEEVRAERSARAAEMEELDKRWAGDGDMVKGPCNFCTDRPYLWELDNLHSILFDGAAQVLSSFVLYGSL